MDDRKNKFKLEYVHLYTLKMYFDQCFDKIVKDANEMIQLPNPTPPASSPIAQGAAYRHFWGEDWPGKEYPPREKWSEDQEKEIDALINIIQAAIDADRREREK